MKKLLLLLILSVGISAAKAQFIYKIKADSVLITNDSCTAELIIENSTKNVKGFLVNKGNGRTEFRRAQQLTDSSFVVAGDTIVIRKIASLSATSPVFYNSSTGVVSSQAASTSLEGYVTTGTQSFAGFKTFSSDQLNLSGSSNGTLGTGVVQRIIDQRTTGNLRIAGLSVATDNIVGSGAVLGQFLAVRSTGGDPFNAVDGVYIRSALRDSAIYMTTASSAGGGTEQKSFGVHPLTWAAVGYMFNPVAGGPGSGSLSNTYHGHAALLGAYTKGPGVAVGYKAEALNDEGTAVGPNAKANGLACIALGDGAWATPAGPNGNETVIGDACWASGDVNYIIGGGAGTTHDYILGFGVVGNTTLRNEDFADADHQGYFGSYNYQHPAFGDGFINDWFWGPKFTDVTHDITFNMASGVGTNVNGSNTTWNASRGTGSGTAGKFIFSTSSPTTSGTTTQTLSTKMVIDSAGVGFPVASPSAYLHLGAGTATASTAPLKFTAGTTLTTPEDGAIEYDGGNYYATTSSTRYTLAKTLTTTATLNFVSTAAQTSADLTITVTGAADGDVVYVGAPNAAVNPNTCYTAFVSASNTVTVRFSNYSSAAVDPASATFRVSVLKY